MNELFELMSRPEVWALVLAGSVIGYVFGVLPGLNGVTALALLAPIGLYLDPSVAFFFFAALLGAASFAGSVPAILLRIPGTPFSIVTTFDGYPLAKQGRAMEALTISAAASALGGVISVVFLIALFPFARDIVFLFGPAERFWLITLALILVPFLSGIDLLKGLVAALAGISLGFVGRNIVTGDFRYTMGSTYLSSGLDVIAFLAIGVMAVATLFELMARPSNQIDNSGASKVASGQIMAGLRFVLRRPATLFRGSVVGTVTGIIPGLGGTTASFFSYSLERTVSKSARNFGRGAREGVMAPEAANNATAGGGLVPTLMLGVPGSIEWAVLLGIFFMYGIQAGPELLTEHPAVVYGILGGIVLSCVIASTVGVAASFLLAKLTAIQPFYLACGLFGTSMVGAYILRLNFWDIVIAVVGGVIGFYVVNLNYGLLPFALGFILSRDFEYYFFFTLQSGNYDASAFVNSALSTGLVVMCVLVIAFGRRLRRRLMRGVEA